MFMPILFTIMYYSYPEDTKGRRGYGYLITFSLWDVLPIGIIFFIIAGIQWINRKRSAQVIQQVSARRPPIRTRAVITLPPKGTAI